MHKVRVYTKKTIPGQIRRNKAATRAKTIRSITGQRGASLKP